MQQATRSIFTGALLFVASSVFATTAGAQTVKVNWQQSAPFSDYHTYAWKHSQNEGSDFYKQWVRRDVDEEMAKKGLQKVDPAQNPDLLLMYHIVTQEVLDSTTTDDGFGWGGGPWGYWGGWGGWGAGAPGIAETETHPRLMGMLALDMCDAKKKELVWRGQATVDAVSNTQKGDEKQTQSSVKKMFDKFPPKEKG
jgi:Domain of unknown function (DUF4136)